MKSAPANIGREEAPVLYRGVPAQQVVESIEKAFDVLGRAKLGPVADRLLHKFNRAMDIGRLRYAAKKLDVREFAGRLDMTGFKDLLVPYRHLFMFKAAADGEVELYQTLQRWGAFQPDGPMTDKAVHERNEASVFVIRENLRRLRADECRPSPRLDAACKNAADPALAAADIDALHALERAGGGEQIRRFGAPGGRRLRDTEFALLRLTGFLRRGQELAVEEPLRDYSVVVKMPEKFEQEKAEGWTWLVEKFFKHLENDIQRHEANVHWNIDEVEDGTVFTMQMTRAAAQRLLAAGQGSLKIYDMQDNHLLSLPSLPSPPGAAPLPAPA